MDSKINAGVVKFRPKSTLWNLNLVHHIFKNGIDFRPKSTLWNLNLTVRDESDLGDQGSEIYLVEFKLYSQI